MFGVTPQPLKKEIAPNRRLTIFIQQWCGFVHGTISVDVQDDFLLDAFPTSRIDFGLVPSCPANRTVRGEMFGLLRAHKVSSDRPNDFEGSNSNKWHGGVSQSQRDLNWIMDPLNVQVGKGQFVIAN